MTNQSPLDPESETYASLVSTLKRLRQSGQVPRGRKAAGMALPLVHETPGLQGVSLAQVKDALRDPECATSVRRGTSTPLSTRNWWI